MIAETGGEEMPTWARLAGGPNGAMPGASVTAYVDLRPGDYVAIDVIPGPNGTPHVAEGFHHAFEVTDTASGAQAPSPDATVTLVDFVLDGHENLAPGTSVVQAVNEGGRPHELTLVRLEGNASVDDFLQATGPNATGPPPGSFAGGITGIEAGSSQSFRVDLEPGRYAVICFLPDVTAPEHTPHFVKGMAASFTVSAS